tara:strand:+ start:2545 stop:2892 length:348 start_codon:yes stop_codon:yes gene_type:complete
MKDYNLQNSKSISNGLTIIDRLSTEIERLKIDRITDAPLLRYLDHFIIELSKIRTLYIKNPRFDWVQIQEEFDLSYAKDKNQTGFYLIFDFKQVKNPNRGLIKYQILKNKDHGLS